MGRSVPHRPQPNPGPEPPPWPWPPPSPSPDAWPSPASPSIWCTAASHTAQRANVAHEVQAMGARGIACLNSRDRNLLGFRRDLLTAAAYGVDEFLFVYGDRPESGARSDDLTVRTMLAVSTKLRSL